MLAHPETTSPVRRGKWVLEQLLCQPPPPPPADVDIPPLVPNDGETMAARLTRRGLGERTRVIHNWADGEALAPRRGAGDALRRAWSIER